MRFRLRTLLIVLAALGTGLLVLECGIAVIPDDFQPFGIAGWLVQIYVVHYGIPLTLIFILAALAIVAALSPIHRRST
jgi:uncharacterized membrane protein